MSRDVDDEIVNGGDRYAGVGKHEDEAESATSLEVICAERL